MINYTPGMTVDQGRFQPYDPEAGGALETGRRPADPGNRGLSE